MGLSLIALMSATSNAGLLTVSVKKARVLSSGRRRTLTVSPRTLP